MNLQSQPVQNLLKSLGCVVYKGRIVDTYNPLYKHLRIEGIGADGLSGTVDTGGITGPSGGSPYSGEDEDQVKPNQIPDPKIKMVREGRDNHAINGACPFCGSKKFDGLLPTDFESQHCSKCGRVVVTHDSNVMESDVLAYSGSAGITFTDQNATLPWDRDQVSTPVKKRVKVKEVAGNPPSPYLGFGTYNVEVHYKDRRPKHTASFASISKAEKYVDSMKDKPILSGAKSLFLIDKDRNEFIREHHFESIHESEGFMLGYPTDATSTGKIQILVLDNVNLKVHALWRILEQIEAYHFFEQFQFLLPRTPMLNVNVMDSVSRWWRSHAIPGDLLEIDSVTGQSVVTNETTNNMYSLGCLGTMPTTMT